MICPECQKDYPEHLLRDLAVNDAEGLRYRRMCPICALVIINKAGGLPEGTPFAGPIAARLHAEALRHLKATGQEK